MYRPSRCYFRLALVAGLIYVSVGSAPTGADESDATITALQTDARTILIRPENLPESLIRRHPPITAQSSCRSRMERILVCLPGSQQKCLQMGSIIPVG